MSHPLARAFRVQGRVQGVFFRDSTRQEADRLGVSGWVSNEPDGSVSGHVQGAPEAVRELLDWLAHGPPAARVARVEVTYAAIHDLPGFTVR